MIEFQCPECDKVHSVKDESEGRKATCSCGTKIVIPSIAPNLKIRDSATTFEEHLEEVKFLLFEIKTSNEGIRSVIQSYYNFVLIVFWVSVAINVAVILVLNSR